MSPYFVIFPLVILTLLLVWSYFYVGEIIVTSSEELKNAIDNAEPGQTIILGPSTFEGEFIAKLNGTESTPITLKGTSDKTKVIGKSHGTAFTILGNHWNIEKLAIYGYDIGLLVEGKGSKLKGLNIKNISRAIDVQENANDTEIMDCKIDNSTIYGISINANHVVLSDNIIQNANCPSIVIEDASCFGAVVHNIAMGAVKVKGSYYSFSSNVFAGPMEVTGCRNTIVRQSSPSPVFTKRCSNTVSGNGFY